MLLYLFVLLHLTFAPLQFGGRYCIFAYFIRLQLQLKYIIRNCVIKNLILIITEMLSI